jgi:hypothetical protein
VAYEDEGDYVVIKHAALFTSTLMSKVLQVRSGGAQRPPAPRLQAAAAAAAAAAGWLPGCIAPAAGPRAAG